MNNPRESPDTVIRTVAEKRDALAAAIERLDAMIQAYADRPRKETTTLPVINALDHYSMLEGSECGCATCTEWETRRNEFVDAGKLVPQGHKWSTCGCMVCRFVGRIQLNYLAATNRRDLLISTSFHARYHSPFGSKVMAWLERELTKPDYTDNWCAQEMSRYPVEWWLRRCEATLGPIVSGAVFRDSMMVTDMQVHFGSSLLAEGEYSF